MIADLVITVVLLLSAVIAFIRGFIREMLTIFGTIGALAASYFGGPYFIPYIHDWLGVVPDEQPERLLGILPYDILGNIIAYGTIFIVVVIVLSVFSHFLAEGVKSLGLGALDRTLGVIFGLARGALLLGLLYLPFHLMVEEETKARWFEGSKSYFYLEKTAAFMARFLPESAKEDIEQKVGEGAESTREKLQKMDILQKDGTQEEKAPQGREKDNGYTDEFRNEMDRLFEEKTDDGKNLNE